MEKPPPLDPDVADIAPTERALTPYDLRRRARYHLHADVGCRCWRRRLAGVARVVLQIDPDLDAARARRSFESHLARAKWMSSEG